MIKMIKYETEYRGTRYFLFDEDVLKTEKEINYALNMTDGGLDRVSDCVNLSEAEYELIKRAVHEFIEDKQTE